MNKNTPKKSSNSKTLTVEDLKKVIGGLADVAPALKMEDSAGAKGEAS